jgi:NAD(P)-dependent dehydrogenase (short-subunit alcohol dehydrogenase family)
MPSKPISLSGRVVAVTGASRGIGLATVRELLGRGVRVVAGLRDPGRLPAAAGLLALPLEVDDAASCQRFVTAALDRLGRIDGLVNNAGILLDDGVPPLDVADAVLRQTLEVNLLGPLRLCRLVLPGMVEGGFGRVVNVSSGYGEIARLGDDGIPLAYGLSKLALNGMTRRLAAAVSGDVKVNALCPGWVRTDMGGAGAPRPAEAPAREIADLLAVGPDGPNGGFFREGEPAAW